MKSTYILPLNEGELKTVGGKGASLARLVNAGLPVPDGFHVTTAAYRHFADENDLQPRVQAVLMQADVTQPATLEMASARIRDLFAAAAIPSVIANEIRDAYADLVESSCLLYPASCPVAVRSSATAEDLPDLSFAGQQETFLNIEGADAVLEAVKRCWASLWTARAIDYRVQHTVDQDAVSLAVVVQRLVPADAAGILFTANPLNGSRDKAVINAAWGLGEAVVGGLVTPDTLIVEKATGRVLSRKTADKQTMTVRIASGTVEQSVPQSKRRAPVLSDTQAAELVQLGARIEALYGIPMDIEWTLTLPAPSGGGIKGGGAFAIVQARPITALPEPELPVPTAWKLSKGQYIAMRNNIVELMADPLTPLFGTLGLTAINTSLGRLLTDFFGKPGIVPDELIIKVNEYAYYNGSFSAWQFVKIIFGSVGIMKRMFTGAVERWTETGRPSYVATVERWQADPWRERPATEILDAVRELAEAAINGYGALVSGVIPAAWITEGLFTFVYKLLIKRRTDPNAPIYLLGFDSLPIRAEKSLYDLAMWVRSRIGLAAYLTGASAAQIAAQSSGTDVPFGTDVEDWREWRARFSTHLADYGHTIYNLDFGNPVPADDPAPLLETFKLFLAGEGTNPYVRQQAAAEHREQVTETQLRRLKGVRLKLFRKFLATAQRYAPLREDGLADVGLSYPLLREMLRELGQRFVEGGVILQADDIFWLTQDEVEESAARLDRGESLRDLSATVPQRHAIWNTARRASPPMMLPQMKIFGVDLVELKSGGARRQKGNVLRGVAASPGRVSAPARVLNGPEDFAQMQTGDVLVAALTTPAWTPLFARAAAVVTDVGGPLSHGSIVAREYGIPAVLGTGVATRRIRSGQVITVDGGEGVVIV